jgi:hemoglobin-like flavoprotein
MIPNRQCPFEPSNLPTTLPKKSVQSEDDPHHLYKAISPTQAEIDIVRYSWERVSEIRLPQDDIHVSPSHAFGLVFYEVLFEMDPSLKQLFSNIFLQARALAGMLGYIARVPNATEPEHPKVSIREINAKKRKETKANSFQESITTAATSHITYDDGSSEFTVQKLQELGARHYFYDVHSDQLAIMGPAILAALKRRLGKEYLPAVEEAWIKVSNHN